MRNAELATLLAELTPVVGAMLPASLLPLQSGDWFAPIAWRAHRKNLSDVFEVELRVLVSPRARIALEEIQATGVAFSKMAPDSRSPKEAAQAAEGYLHMTVTARTGLPPGLDRSMVCPECNRAVVPLGYDPRELRITDEMWPGTDVALLETTLYVAVTDRVKDALESIGATGVRFAPADRAPDRQRG